MGAPVKSALAALLLAASLAQAGFDPTAPPRQTASASGNDAPASLAWVRLDGRHSLAWYGGRLVRLGDRVEEGRIAAIREDHIVVVGRQGRRIVHLFEPGVRAHRTDNRR